MMGKIDKEFIKDTEPQICGRCKKRNARVGDDLCEQCEDEYIEERNKRAVGHA